MCAHTGVIITEEVYRQDWGSRSATCSAPAAAKCWAVSQPWSATWRTSTALVSKASVCCAVGCTPRATPSWPMSTPLTRSTTTTKPSPESSVRATLSNLPPLNVLHQSPIKMFEMRPINEYDKMITLFYFIFKSWSPSIP